MTQLEVWEGLGRSVVELLNHFQLSELQINGLDMAPPKMDPFV